MLRYRREVSQAVVCCSDIRLSQPSERAGRLGANIRETESMKFDIDTEPRRVESLSALLWHGETFLSSFLLSSKCS